jgi:hypothetical protein
VQLPEYGVKIPARTAIRAWLKLRKIPAKLIGAGKTSLVVRFGEEVE